MNEEQVINFRFTAIHILSKKLEPLQPERIPDTFYFEIKTEIKVQQAMKLVISHVNVQIKDDKTQKELAYFTIACFFEVDDFDKVITLNDEKLFVIPKPLQNIVQPVSISTTRGIIYSELRGTYLQNAIMPVVFVNEMKPEPTKTV